MSEHCLFLDSAGQAQKAWQEINPLLRASSQRKISIVGAGATGVKLAGELAKVRTMLQRYPQEVSLEITLIEAADRVLPAGPECMSKRVHEALVKQGINVRTGTRIQRAEEAKLVTSEDEVISADLQVWAAGIKCADWLSQLDGLETNRINQLVVDQPLRTTNDNDIFVIGDIADLSYLALAIECGLGINLRHHNSKGWCHVPRSCLFPSAICRASRNTASKDSI